MNLVDVCHQTAELAHNIGGTPRWLGRRARRVATPQPKETP